MMGEIYAQKDSQVRQGCREAHPYWFNNIRQGIVHPPPLYTTRHFRIRSKPTDNEMGFRLSKQV